MKVKKDIWVKFTEEVYKGYTDLQNTVIEERKKGIENSFNMQLLRAIDREVDNLKIDPQRGIHIPHRNIPKEIYSKYGADNFWKINLPDYWRMVYTITGNKVEIIALVLEILDHKRYSKLFEYR